MTKILASRDDGERREVEGWDLFLLVMTEIFVTETDSLVVSHNRINFEDFNGNMNVKCV